LFSLLAASALAQNPSYGPPQVKEEVFPPQPFAYQYGVQDTYSGSNFGKTETQDEGGNVNGEYTIALPDGRTQIVKYRADGNGYVADVSFEGVAQYPDDVKPSYGPAPLPAYKPAPIATYQPAPVVSYQPAPVVSYQPAPVVSYEPPTTTTTPQPQPPPLLLHHPLMLLLHHPPMLLHHSPPMPLPLSLSMLQLQFMPQLQFMLLFQPFTQLKLQQPQLLLLLHQLQSILLLLVPTRLLSQLSHPTNQHLPTLPHNLIKSNFLTESANSKQSLKIKRALNLCIYLLHFNLMKIENKANAVTSKILSFIPPNIT